MSDVLVGGHLDNLDEPPNASYAKLRAMQARVVGTMWTPGTHHRRAVYDRLEAELGGPEYVVRVGPSGQTSPGAWLEDARSALREIPSSILSEGRARLRVLNEVNLPEEGDWSPGGYAAFLMSVATTWTATWLVASPISLGRPGWQDWYARFLAACGGKLPVTHQAVNCYAHLATPENLAVFAKAGRLIDVTEMSTLAIPPGPDRALWVATEATRLVESTPLLSTVQQFIVGGRSNGAWDDRYIMDMGEAIELGYRLGGTIHRQEATVLRGVDISNNNGYVDFDKLAGSLVPDPIGGPVAFVIAKASGDETSRHRYIDGDFPYNLAQARRAELHAGAYHYAKPSLVSPAASVTTFLEAIDAAGGLRTGELAALDMEDPDVPVGVSLDTWCAEWGDLFERIAGFKAGLYTGNFYMDEHGLHTPELAKRFGWLWLASWQDTPPPVPPHWPSVLLWQNGVLATGAVDGIATRIDVNVFQGDVESLLALGRPQRPDDPPAPTPGPVDTTVDALNNIYDITLTPGPHSEERRVSAQRAINLIKNQLGLT